MAQAMILNSDSEVFTSSQDDMDVDSDKENVELKYFQSQRGKRKVAVLGYCYTINKEGKNGSLYW